MTLCVFADVDKMTRDCRALLIIIMLLFLYDRKPSLKMFTLMYAFVGDPVLIIALLVVAMDYALK